MIWLFWHLHCILIDPNKPSAIKFEAFHASLANDDYKNFIKHFVKMCGWMCQNTHFEHIPQCWKMQFWNILILLWSFEMSVQSLSHVWFCDPHGLLHARLPGPSPTPRACSSSYPSSQWCHPTISSSIISYSSCLQSFPASESFPMSQFSHKVAKVLELQHQSFQWIFMVDSL